jgi:hypothetical protein
MINKPLWIVPVLVLFAAGCGGKTEKLPDLVPVSGTVTYDGAPLVGAFINFVPQEGTPGSGASGTSDAEGKYQLTTGNRNEPGTAAGKYKVTILTPLMFEGYEAPPDAPPFTKVKLPPKYSDAEKTVLTAEVTAEKKPIDFDLKSK